MALLEATAIEKAYPGVKALAGVDLEVDSGEIHALLGQNGAGKSTLMKVIAGDVDPDAGAITVSGGPIPLGSPERARDAGIALVHQELSLVPQLSVAENVVLGRWPTRRGTVDRKAMTAIATENLKRVGFEPDPSTPVGQLGMAERQLVELAKALSLDAKVLLLDEPTSALSDRETGRLFEICRALRDDGIAMVYVSHRLREIVEICDRVTILRDGRKVETAAISEVDEEALARMMVGDSRVLHERTAAGDSGSKDSEVALAARGFGRAPRLKPVDFELRRGEIVAVFGLVGAGRTRLANSLFGLEPATEGRLELFGEPTKVGDPIAAIKGGMGYVGEDRSVGLVPQLSVAANITLAARHTDRFGVLSFKRERELAESSVADLGIKVTSVSQAAGTLSGGNQQKVVLGRWTCSGARILILDDPTRGIDIGAKDELFDLIRRLAGEGAAILYFTSEIHEARNLGHRILVMANGGFADELPGTASDDEIMAAAGGAHA